MEKLLDTLPVEKGLYKLALSLPKISFAGNQTAAKNQKFLYPVGLLGIVLMLAEQRVFDIIRVIKQVKFLSQKIEADDVPVASDSVHEKRDRIMFELFEMPE